MHAYSIDTFTWDPHARRLSAEASDLQLRRFERLYDDACDIGIAIAGAAGTLTFYLAETDTDGEGDITFWRLAPTPETLRRKPDLRDLRVIIFND